MYIACIVNQILSPLITYNYTINRTFLLLFCRQNGDLFTLFYSIIEGDFGAAFAGGWGVLFIVVDDTISAFIYNLIVTLDIGSSTRADDVFRIVCVLVVFQQVVLIMLAYIRIFCSHIDSFYVRVFFFYFGYKFEAQAIKLTLAPEKECVNLFLTN